MNKVILMGRLTRVPEIRTTQSGKSVTHFTIAINRRTSQNKEADFVNCIAWEKTAEFIGRYFTKGSMIAVSGEIRTRTYEDTPGHKQFITEVLAHEVYFTGEKAQGNGQGNQYGGGQNYPYNGNGNTNPYNGGQNYPYNGNGNTNPYNQQGQQMYGFDETDFRDIDYNEDDLPF